MKINRTAVAHALCAAFLSVVGSNSLVQADPPGAVQPILPNALRKGINLPYVFGAMNHRIAQGHANPYNVNRMRNMMDTENQGDFKAIAEAGFGHVRIVVDPLALGMTDPAITPNPNAIGWTPLFEDIEEATSYGLFVIIDFHPHVLAQSHWELLCDDWLTSYSPYTSWAELAAARPYTGTHKWRFLDGSALPLGQPPLATFWSEFINQFESIRATREASFSNEQIAFEILNEPFEDLVLNMNASKLQSANLQRPWIEDQMVNWRGVVKSTVVAIQNALGSQVEDQPLIIVPPYVSLPYGTGHPEFYNSFQPLQAHEVPNERKVVYSWHLYEPMKFTHRSLTPMPSIEYTKDRDWLGTVTGTPYDCDPMASGTQVVAQANAHILNWQAYADTYLEYYPMVLMGEFGCARTGYIVGVGDDQGQLQQGQEEEPLQVYRAHWLWDTRKWVETSVDNAGWTAYEYIGNLSPLWSGKLNADTDYNVHSGDRGQIFGYASQALFSNQRPFP